MSKNYLDLKVADLREECKKRNLDSNGLKVHLLSRLAKYDKEIQNEENETVNGSLGSKYSKKDDIEINKDSKVHLQNEKQDNLLSYIKEVTTMQPNFYTEPDNWELRKDVHLDFYNCDLNIAIESNGFSAKTINTGGLEYMFGGVKANYGINKGKVYYEVKIIKKIEVKLEKEMGESNSVKLGWSSSNSPLTIGEEKLSFAYDGEGKKMLNGIITNYGVSIKAGDIIGCFLEFSSNSFTISFSVNGFNHGVAYIIPRKELGNQFLVPHIYARNMIFDVNFGMNTSAVFPPTINKGNQKTVDLSWTILGKVNITDLLRGHCPPKYKSECEVFMMIGLPNCGKTTWVNKTIKSNPDKLYNVLSPKIVLDKMKIEKVRQKFSIKEWNNFIEISAKCLNKLIEIAACKRRNFIIDQTNVYANDQERIMQKFEGFNRKAIIIVPTDEEYQKRIKEATKDKCNDLSDSSLFQLKDNFTIPAENSQLFKVIFFTELRRTEAEKLINKYNDEAKTKRIQKDRLDFDGDCQPASKKSKPSEETFVKKNIIPITFESNKDEISLDNDDTMRSLDSRSRSKDRFEGRLGVKPGVRDRNDNTGERSWDDISGDTTDDNQSVGVGGRGFNSGRLGPKPDDNAVKSRDISDRLGNKINATPQGDTQKFNNSNINIPKFGQPLPRKVLLPNAKVDNKMLVDQKFVNTKPQHLDKGLSEKPESGQPYSNVKDTSNSGQIYKGDSFNKYEDKPSQQLSKKSGPMNTLYSRKIEDPMDIPDECSSKSKMMSNNNKVLPYQNARSNVQKSTESLFSKLNSYSESIGAAKKSGNDGNKLRSQSNQDTTMKESSYNTYSRENYNTPSSGTYNTLSKGPQNTTRETHATQSSYTRNKPGFYESSSQKNSRYGFEGSNAPGSEYHWPMEDSYQPRSGACHSDRSESNKPQPGAPFLSSKSGSFKKPADNANYISQSNKSLFKDSNDPFHKVRTEKYGNLPDVSYFDPSNNTYDKYQNSIEPPFNRLSQNQSNKFSGPFKIPETNEFYNESRHDPYNIPESSLNGPCTAERFKVKTDHKKSDHMYMDPIRDTYSNSTEIDRYNNNQIRESYEHQGSDKYSEPLPYNKRAIDSQKLSNSDFNRVSKSGQFKNQMESDRPFDEPLSYNKRGIDSQKLSNKDSKKNQIVKSFDRVESNQYHITPSGSHRDQDRNQYDRPSTGSYDREVGLFRENKGKDSLLKYGTGSHNDPIDLEMDEFDEISNRTHEAYRDPISGSYTEVDKQSMYRSTMGSQHNANSGSGLYNDLIGGSQHDPLDSIRRLHSNMALAAYEDPSLYLDQKSKPYSDLESRSYNDPSIRGSYMYSSSDSYMNKDDINRSYNDPSSKYNADPLTRSYNDPSSKYNADPLTRSYNDPSSKYNADPLTRSYNDPSSKFNSDPLARQYNDPSSKFNSDPLARSYNDPHSTPYMDKKSKPSLDLQSGSYDDWSHGSRTDLSKESFINPSSDIYDYPSGGRSNVDPKNRSYMDPSSKSLIDPKSKPYKPCTDLPSRSYIDLYSDLQTRSQTNTSSRSSANYSVSDLYGSGSKAPSKLNVAYSNGQYGSFTNTPSGSYGTQSASSATNPRSTSFARTTNDSTGNPIAGSFSKPYSNYYETSDKSGSYEYFDPSAAKASSNRATIRPNRDASRNMVGDEYDLFFGK